MKFTQLAQAAQLALQTLITLYDDIFTIFLWIGDRLPHRKITKENRHKRMRAVSPVQQIFDFRSRNLFTCGFQVNKSDKGKGGEGGIFLFILKFLFLNQIVQLRWNMKAL